jgi:hypothetical protein
MQHLLHHKLQHLLQHLHQHLEQLQQQGVRMACPPPVPTLQQTVVTWEAWKKQQALAACNGAT